MPTPKIWIEREIFHRFVRVYHFYKANKDFNLMPKIATYKYFTFLIVMFDTLGEPPHLHIIKNKSGHKRMAKIWLETLLFAEKGDLTETELTTVEKIVKKNQTALLKRFIEVRNQEKHKPLNLK